MMPGRRLVLALLVGSVLAWPAPGRGAGEWHSAPLPEGSVAPVGQGEAWDVVFLDPPAAVGLEGFIVTRTATPAVSVVPFVLPDAGPPSWDPAAASAQGWTGDAPRIAASGRRVILTHQALNAGHFDGTAWSDFPATAQLQSGVAFDVQGNDRAIVGTTAAFTGFRIVQGGTWPVTSTGFSQGEVFAWSGQRVLAFGTFGSLASTDGAATFLPTALTVFPQDIVAPPGATGGFWAVSQAGTYRVIDDPAGTFVETAHDTGGAEDLVAIGRNGGEAWVLQSEGTLHWHASGESPDWLDLGGTYLQWSTGLPVARGLAVAGDHQAVAVGADGAGLPMIAWRNRPPGAPSLLDAAVEEGSGADKSITADGGDPEGAGVVLAWDCSDGSTGSGATPGVPFDLLVPDQPACEGESYVITCAITATETGAGVEGLSSPPETLDVQVAGVDDAPPTVQALELREAGAPLADPVEVAVAASLTAEALATDLCDPGPLGVSWRLLDAAGNPLSVGPSAATWTFPAPDPGASAQTFRVEATVRDAAGNATVATRDFTVHPPTLFTLTCPASIVAGETDTVTATVQSGAASVAWSHVDASSFVSTLQPAGLSASLTPDACGFLAPGEGVTVTATPDGPGGGSPESCLVPILPGATRPSLDLLPGGDPIVWELPVAGGSLTLEPLPGFACGDEQVRLRWDLRGLPGELHPAGAAGGLVDQAQALPLTLEATADEVAAVLGAAGSFEGPLVLEGRYLPGTWHEDDPAAYPPVVLERTLRIVPAPATETTVALLASGAVGPGEIVPARITFRSDVPVSEVRLGLAARGLSLVPGSRVEVASGCATTSAAAAAAPGGLVLALDAVPAACTVELTALLRVEWGASSLAFEACTWREGPLACEGRAVLGRAGMFGCDQGRGAGGGALALGLLLLGLWWRPRR
ncbi:MAG: hypothetical protein P1V51_20925 [Deltaproteobacteria bacterium]|nr:hypothetical protein [Deltaproteobacteria bacterium]